MNKQASTKICQVLQITQRILTDKLRNVTEANFEGANIVLYTDDKSFFLEGERKIKEIVTKFEKGELKPEDIYEYARMVGLSPKQVDKTIRIVKEKVKNP